MAAFPTSVATDSDLYIAVNATSTQLTDNPLLIGATTVNVTSTAAFPTVGFISIDNEIIKYTGKSGTSFTGCTRGSDGTSASSHVQNSQVFHNVIAIHHNALKDDLIATEQFISDLIGRVNTQIRAPSGSAAAPSHSFSGDTNTGIYSSGGDSIGFSCNGTQVMEIDPGVITPGSDNTVALGSTALGWTRIFLKSGTNTAPAFTFRDDADTGMYRTGADVLDFASGGVRVFSVSDGGSANPVVAVQATGGILRIQDGTPTIPGFNFVNDLDTGIYRAGANDMRLVTGGTAKLQIDGSFLYPLVQIQSANGSATAPTYSFFAEPGLGWYRASAGRLSLAFGTIEAAFFDGGLGVFGLKNNYNMQTNLGTNAAPGYSFNGDSDTGIYSAGANTINFTTNGTARMSIDTTSATINIPLYMGDGTAAAPSHSFGSNTSTGMYRSAANNLAFSTNGTLGMVLDSSQHLNLTSGSAAAPAYTFTADGDTGLFTGSSNTLSVTIGGVETFRIEPANSANDIRMVVYDHTAGALKGVSRGVADSGGTGFRLLRILN